MLTFFFQAEDGIRDGRVTGVQTCALPILTLCFDPRDMAEIRVFHGDRFLCQAGCPELAGATVPLREVLRARNRCRRELRAVDRKSTRLNSSHPSISYAVFCLKKKNVNDRT